MQFDPNKYLGIFRNESTRRPGWDYGSPAFYFVTICTHDRIPFFGKIDRDVSGNAVLFPTPIGIIARECWEKIGELRKNVDLHSFVIMPNHIHGILEITSRKDGESDEEWVENRFDIPLRTLPSTIQQFKRAVTYNAKMAGFSFAWQTRYHDRIIRDEKEFQIKCWYIDQNPEKWLAKYGDDDPDVDFLEWD